jgi:hypothetical protein
VTDTHDQQLLDGNSIHTSMTTHQWRDSSGRTRSESAIGCFPGDDGEMHARIHVSVFDRVNGSSYSWTLGPGDSKLVTVSRAMHIPAPPLLTAEERQKRQETIRRQRVEETFHNESLGTKVIQGVQAEGSKVTHTLPIGRVGNALPLTTTEEIWIAKDSGLTMLRLRDDPQTGKWRTEVVELKQGEPDPSLFVPPPDYTLQELVTKTVAPPTAP